MVDDSSVDVSHGVAVTLLAIAFPEAETSFHLAVEEDVADWLMQRRAAVTCALIGGIPWTMVKTSLCLSMCCYGMIRCPCTERIPYVMKTLKRHKMPQVHSRGFGFLELCRYGIRELAGMSNM